jgi:heterodisulfide reductase subunit D
MSYLKEYEDEIYGCTTLRCGGCGLLCPGYTAVGFESNTPRGKMRIARGVLEGELELTDALVERIYFCVQCGACTDRCAFSPTHVVDALKAEIVKAGKGPRQAVIMSQSLEQHNMCFQPHEKRLECLPEEDRKPRKADVLFYVSCHPAYLSPTSVHATGKVLDAAGVKWTTLGEDEWCCGLPMIQAGMPDKAREYFEHNVEAINRAAKDLGVTKLIASCPGCTTGFKKFPARYGLKLDVEVLHTTEFFAQLIRERRMRFKEWEATVAYHDACQLRWQGVYDEPRECLKAIPGVELVEIEPNRDFASCCGAIPWWGSWEIASGLRPDPRYVHLTHKITLQRIREIEETKADTLVVGCRGCLKLRTMLKAKRSTIKVMLISEALEENLIRPNVIEDPARDKSGGVESIGTIVPDTK